MSKRYCISILVIALFQTAFEVTPDAEVLLADLLEITILPKKKG